MAEARCLVSPARVFARPTADQIWLGETQQGALSQLSRNTRIRLLVGPPSSGKTALVNHVAHRLARECIVLQCRGPKEDAVAVLSSLLLSAGSRSMGALRGRAAQSLHGFRPTAPHAR